MLVPSLRAWAAASAALLVASILVSAVGQPSRRDADQLRQKVTAIVQFALRPGREARRTTVTENEVNAYLAFDARDDLPPGVVDPVVTIAGNGRVSGRANVDLDAVRQQQKP